jgi:hypothetical protein
VWLFCWTRCLRKICRHISAGHAVCAKSNVTFLRDKLSAIKPRLDLLWDRLSASILSSLLPGTR